MSSVSTKAVVSDYDPYSCHIAALKVLQEHFGEPIFTERFITKDEQGLFHVRLCIFRSADRSMDSFVEQGGDSWGTVAAAEYAAAHAAVERAKCRAAIEEQFNIFGSTR